MPKFTKHVGVNHLGSKIVIVFRELPDDPSHALIVYSNALSEMYHDQLMRVIDSEDAQQTVDLYEILSRRVFGDGRQMLQALHANRLLVKVPVDQIQVMPMPSRGAPLREVNDQIRASRGMPKVDAVQAAIVQATPEEGKEALVAPLSEDRKAAAESKLTQARLLEEDALRLREEAYLLDPDLKKGGRPSKKKTKTEVEV